MKRITILSVLVLFSSIIFSQAWESLLPQNKKDNGTLTLHDYQEAFNTYWAPYNVDSDGYYMKDGEKTKATGWKPFKRWEWTMKPRVGINGEFPKTSDYTEWKKYLQKFPNATKNVAGNWTSLGLNHSDPDISANGIGQLGCVAFHPTDTNTFWVGAGFSGLWVTYDGGNNWQVLNDELGVLGVADIVVLPDYDVSQTIYIATGSRVKKSLGSLGVLKSTDGGQNWQETGLSFLPEDGKYVYRLLIYPGFDNLLLAATSEGVYRSNNGGDTWNLASTWEMLDLEFHPTDPSIIYGGDRGNGKIYRSTGTGLYWDEIYSSGGKRVELAVSEESPDIVYAIISGEGGGLKGIYKSLNSGDDFDILIDGQTPGNNFLGRKCDATDVNVGQGDFDLCIAANPIDVNEVIIGGIHTWKSTNGGIDWYIINGNYVFPCLGGVMDQVHVDQHWLEFQPVSNTLFEVNDGGIYKSYDYEYNWENLSNGLEIAQIYRIGLSQLSPDRILAGTHHNGNKRFTGTYWQRITGSDGMNGIVDYSDENIQYAVTQNGGIERTFTNWLMDRTPISPAVGAWVTPLMLDPVDPNILYVGTKQLHKSTDRGNNYDVIFDAEEEKYILAMAIAPSNPDVIYCSTDSLIWKTQNGGNYWQNISNNLPLVDRYIVSIAVKDTDENTLWVSLSGYDEHGVYKSTDGGQNWTNISYGLPNVPVFSVIQNKLITYEEEIYAATSHGVFVKIKEGTAWVLFNNQLPYGPVHEVEIYYDGSNSKIVAGTWGRGVWRSDLYSYESNAAEVWTGIKSTDWFDGDNWQYGSVPGADNDVTIPSGVVMPVIAGVTAYCNSLTIENGASIEVVNNLTINGNFNNSGELIMSGTNPDLDISGNVYFKDGSTADIQTSGSTIRVEGSWVFDELSDAALDNGTVVFNGPFGKSVKNLSTYCWFNNITISKDPNKYIYFSPGSTYDLVIKGDLFISGDNTYRHYGGLNTVIEGSLFNYGTILAYSGGIELAGAGSGINSNGNSYFNNLILSDGVNSIGDKLEVRGDLIFEGGTLNGNNDTILIEGNWINNEDVNAFIASTGRVIFEGDDGQSITGNVNFNEFENNISSGYIRIVDEVVCNQYDWTNGGMRVNHDDHSTFIAMDLADNGIYGDYILNYGNIELHSLGYIHLCGNITINGGDFVVYGGSINSDWPGFVDASLTMTDGVLDFKDMGINIKSSAQSLNLNITGGEIKTIGSFYDYRGDFHPTGGEVTLYGQYNAYIDCISGSSFNELIIDKDIVKDSKSVSVSLWKDVVAQTCVIDGGDFDINGKTIYVDGLFSVKNGGKLVMTNPADSVNAGTFWWNIGSMANITDGDIVLRNDWGYADSTLAELSGTNQLILVGNETQTIKIYDENASFSSIRIDKTGGNVYTDADYINDIYIKNHLHIITQALYLNGDNVDVEGTTYIGSAGSLFIENGSTIETGHNNIVGDMEVSKSDVTVNQEFFLHPSGTLIIEDTSSFVLEKPFDGTMINVEGLLELNGGLFEISNNGMEIGAANSIIFNGGELKIGSNLNVPNSGYFNPNQGAAEFIGANNGWINLAAGNSFHNLVIDKDISSSVVLDSEITVNNDLIIQSGELKAESNAIEVIDIIIEPQGILNPDAGDITISGNWTNNHGPDGFIENGSHVSFIDYYYDSHILSDEVFNILNIEKASQSGMVTLPDSINITVQHFNINSGKFIAEGNLKIEGNFNAPLSETFNPTQGYVEFLGLGDSWLQIAAGNHFNDLIVNKPNFSQLELLSELDIHNDLHIQSGELMTDGYDVEAVNITIESLGILNSGGSNIDLHGNWTNYHGYDGFIEDGSNITFIDFYYQSSILTEDQFNILTIQKLVPEGSVSIAEGVGIRVNQLEINSGKFITGNNTSTLIYNDVVVNSNTSLIMPDAPSNGLLQVGGEFSIDNNGILEISSGNDVSISQFIHDGELRVNGGNINCSSILHFGNSSSTIISGGTLSFSKTTPSWLDLDGEITISGGTLDALHHSINFEPSLSGGFSGGAIVTGGSLKAQYENIFQQNGGEVIFTGSSDSTLYMADGCYINDFTCNKTGGALTLLTDLNVVNDFTLNSGYFDKSTGTLSVGRNWVNYAGPSSINLSSGVVQFVSDKPATILTDETFNALFIDKSLADGNYLDVIANKNIQVNKHFIAMDGMLKLNDNCYLGVEAMFQLQDGAGICIDENAETATIRIKGDWDNQNTTNSEFSGFFANTSTVIFDGNNNQEVNGASFEENFYNLLVQKPSGEFKPNVNMSVSNDIIVDEGIWSYGNTGLYYDLYGNLTINPAGSWQDDQNLLVFSSGDDVEFSNNSTIGSQFGDININLVQSTTNLQVTGDFSCESITIHNSSIAMENIEVSVSDGIGIYNDAHMTMGNASTLKMGSYSDITVSGGLLSFTGDETSTNLITRKSSDYYSFNISDNGSLDANHTTFEFMDTEGIHIHNTGLLAGLNPLQNCSFQNGETSGTLLKVENNQELEILEANFPTNIWGSLYNVSKTNNEGSLTFYDSEGDFSGELFENDPFNRVVWGESGIRLDAIVYIEGPFNGTDMNTDLNALGLLPFAQPFNVAPWNYAGTESVTSIPTTSIVDWVFIELRDAVDVASATPATMVEQRAAFLLENGSIVDLDGSSILSFNHSLNHSLFIVIKHRNHLGIMSAYPLTKIEGIYSYDFTIADSQAFGNNQINLGGVFGMIGGDANADGEISGLDNVEVWNFQAGQKGYMSGDVNMDTQVTNKDKNDIWNKNFEKIEILPD